MQSQIPARFGRYNGLAVALIACLTSFVDKAPATPLIIQNASFELPVTADGTNNVLPSVASQGGAGWTFASGAPLYCGVTNPTSDSYPTAGGDGTPFGADGSQVGYIAVGSISQTLSGADGILGNTDDPTFQPFTDYTLTVAVGARLDWSTKSIVIMLEADGTALSGTGDAGAANPVSGTFIDEQLFIPAANVPSTAYGKPITIFASSGLTPGVIDLDNFRLDATVVPEPSSLAGIGLVVTLLARRRAIA